MIAGVNFAPEMTRVVLGTFSGSMRSTPYSQRGYFAGSTSDPSNERNQTTSPLSTQAILRKLRPLQCAYLGAEVYETYKALSRILFDC